LFGLGGKSNILQTYYDEEDKDKITGTYNSRADMGVTGINYMLPLDKNTYLANRLSVSENGSIFSGQEKNESDELITTNDETLRKYAIRDALSVSGKLSARHFLSGGLEYTQYFYRFFVESYEREQGQMVTEQDQDGNAGLIQFYGNWKFRMTDKLTLVAGMHALDFRLNNDWSVEPRAGLKWQFTPTQRLNFGFGIHSQVESLPTYLVLQAGTSGNYSMPNKNIGLAKARHYVIGYENMFGPNLMLKAEAYYQDLYNIPVENDPASSYSLLNNATWYSTKELVNKGTGYNYGLELTLEKYFANSYFFLLTTSLYESKYRAMDGVLRDTRWNGNYVGNFLFGKEFNLSGRSGKSKTLGINTRFSLIGARRFTPIDLAASREKGYTVTHDDEAFTLRGDDIFVPNISVTYRINQKHVSHEFKADIQNVANCSGVVDEYYNNLTGKIEQVHQLALLPVIMYTIEF
jgi:hypothetical protein